MIQAVIPEELEAFIGAAWGECNPKRKGYRNDHYIRDLVTSSGRLEALHVPRDSEGQFHTQVFDRYSRYEPHAAQGLTQMFVAGTSTQKVGEVAQTLLGVAPSSLSMRRLLSEQGETPDSILHRLSRRKTGSTAMETPPSQTNEANGNPGERDRARMLFPVTTSLLSAKAAHFVGH